MKNIVYIATLFLIIAGLSGCEKEIKDFDGEEGVYFYVQWGPDWFDTTYWAAQPYTKVEFIKKGVDELLLKIRVQMTGRVKDYDRKFRIVVDQDSTTAVKGENYLEFDEWQTIKGGWSYADVPEFTHILTMFSNPVLGMLAGLVLTAIIQSSSASVGILQALCATGSVTFATALPIIMGQNIGTCVTAMISAIGAKKNAKRAALVHLYFNIIGTLVFMCLFYLINAFIHFEFLSQGATPVGIATIHSVFNIFATIILLPFGKGLEKLACLSVRDDKEREETIDANRDFDLLDERFLDKTSLAMEHCRMVTNNMADLSREALFKSLDLFSDFSEEKAGDVCDIEERVDKYEDVLGTYLMKLSSRDLTEQDSETLNMLLHCIGNFERISDHACNLVNAAREMFDKNMHFSEKAALELRIFTEAVRDIVNMAFDAFKAEDINEATKVEPLEEVIDDLNMELKARHIRRLREGKCTIELGFVHSDIITNYERIADHCSNIGVCIIEIRQEGFETHEYLGIMKREDNEQFRKQYALYKEKYKLPETRKFTENDMQPAAVKA